jgi:hypothetical protein
MLAVIAGLYVVLKISSPELIDPFEVMARLEAGAFEQPSQELMAVLLPSMVIMFSLLVVVIVFFIYVAYPMKANTSK